MEDFMSSHLRSKATAIVLVLLVFGSIGVYPPLAARFGITEPRWLTERAVKLGLDLKGGVHLVLRVETDEALRMESEIEMERLREQLATGHIRASKVALVSPTEFKVEGVEPEQDAAFRQVGNQVSANFDRSSGTNGTYRFTMKPTIQANLREDAVVQARQTIERRVNELGVAEPSIAQQGANGDQILVQLPGVTAVDRAKAIIRSTGLLELKIVERGPVSTKDELLTGGQPPEGMQVVPGASTAAGQASADSAFYLVRKVAAVTGRDVRNARPTLDENGRPAVSFTLNAEGSRKFAKVTGENIGRELAIILDGRVQSAPRIDQRIQNEARIAGSFTQEEAQNLSVILRSGSLLAPLTYLEERTIGPGLGADSIRSGVLASVAGLLMIVAFMLVYYKASGVNAVVALLF